ncbi:hypothetical protein E143388_06082 [Rhodococcus opacus]|nr:hypothetical protein E143388_06082 [Rhodococcus opacus]
MFKPRWRAPWGRYRSGYGVEFSPARLLGLLRFADRPACHGCV